MRYPRILTCSSARPRYRNCPSAPHHTRSPVRYIRAPGPPNGHATNRDAGQPGPAHIPIRPPRHRPHTTHRPPRPAPAATTRPAQTTPPRAPASRSARRRPRRQRGTDRGVHRGLGGAVAVDHHAARAPTDPPPRPGRPQPATINAADSRPSGDSAATADGVWLKTLTCSATSKAWKSSGRARHRLGHHHQPPAVQQRAPDLPHRVVEGNE